MAPATRGQKRGHAASKAQKRSRNKYRSEQELAKSMANHFDDLEGNEETSTELMEVNTDSARTGQAADNDKPDTEEIEKQTTIQKLEECKEMMKRLQEEIATMSRQEGNVPVNIMTTDLGIHRDSESTTTITQEEQSQAAVSLTSTCSGRISCGGKKVELSELSVEQQVALLEGKEVREEIKQWLCTYVNRVIFKNCKFRLDESKEKHICRLAAYKGRVVLPCGVTRQVFGERYYLVVRKRMNKLRSNAHAAAKAKFDKDYRAGRVPINFLDNLLNHYRDYLDDKGDLIARREENFKAFAYFVDRILTSVNSTVNDYSPRIRKATLLRQTFSVSDEAFALLLVINYYRRWVRMLEAEAQCGNEQNTVIPNLDMVSQRKDEYFQARFTSSHHGKVLSGWTSEGIDCFTKHANTIKLARQEDLRGLLLEKFLMKYWVDKESSKKRKNDKKRPMVAFMDEDMFGGDMADV